MFETNELKTYAAYLRVSTDDQKDRQTIESQIEFVNKYCDLHQINLFKIYKDDGITGTLPLYERPAGSQLMQDAKNGLFNTLLVYKLDRLGRATRVILNAIHDLESYGVKLKSMTEPFDTGDASGRFLLTILAGVADLERSNILERMWHGANRAARSGKWLGGIVPYGYIKNEDKELIINETPLSGLDISEADVIRLIYKLTVDEKMTTIKIADHLNALGIPPSYVARSSPDTGRRKINTAGIWRPGRVLNMLKSTTYKGIHQYGKRTKKNREIIEREVPAIVSEEIWDQAQQIIKGNFLFCRKNAKHSYLLRGIIKCGNCGHTYHGSTYNDGLSFYCCNGRTSWKQKGKEKCIGKYINLNYLDDLVWNDCLNFINDPELALKEIAAQSNNRPDKSITENERLLMNSKLNEKEQEKERILDLFRKNLINMQDVENQLDKISIDIDTIKSRLNDLNKKDNLSNIFSEKESTLTLLSSFKEKITDDITFETKQEIIKCLVRQVLVTTNTENVKEADIKITYHFSFVPDPTTRVVHCTDRDSSLQ